MKTKNVSKMLSLLLAIAMMVGILTVAANAADVKFTDVPSGSWFYEAVTTCADKGYVSGVGQNKFQPDGKLTYAQVFTMLTNAFYKSEKQDYENNKWMTMDDYFGGNPEWWSYNAYYFMDNGLLSGTSVDIKSSASANGVITRYEVVQIANNILKSKGITVSAEEKAAAQRQISDWSSVPVKYHDAVSTCFSLGIISGYTGNRFVGTDTLTRAQACVILNSLVKTVENGGSGTTTKPPVQDVEQRPIYEYCTCTCDACKACTGTIVGYEPVDKNENGDSNVSSDGVLANGKEITEANVLELLKEVERKYPTGTPWDENGTNPNTVSKPVGIMMNKYNVSYMQACGGFAAMVSDLVFGMDNPCRKLDDLSEIRPGDIIVMLENGRPIHVRIAVSNTINALNMVRCADGNMNSKVLWPSADDPNFDFPGNGNTTWVVYTRYPA